MSFLSTTLICSGELMRAASPPPPVQEPCAPDALDTPLADPYIGVMAVPDEAWLDALMHAEVRHTLNGAPLPGFPSRELQQQFVGSSGEHALREAYGFYRVVKQYSARFGIPLMRKTRLLDFGCGWGRLTRFFLKDVGPNHIVGVDVDPSVISICRSLFPNVSFEVVSASPPCGFPDAWFDVVYLYSVFSHLNEDTHMSWVREFSRILKPGGLLLATTQGRAFIDLCASLREKSEHESLWHKALAESFVDRDAALAAYDRGEFLHSATGGGDYRPPAFYGETLIPRQYVERNWSAHFELLDYRDDPTWLPQALIVAQRRG